MCELSSLAKIWNFILFNDFNSINYDKLPIYIVHCYLWIECVNLCCATNQLQFFCPGLRSTFFYFVFFNIQQGRNMSDAPKTANCRDFSRDSKAVFAVSTIYVEPVFGVSKQAIPKPARSATETS